LIHLKTLFDRFRSALILLYNRVSRFKGSVVIFILFFILACLPFVKFGFTGVVNHFDANFPLDPIVYLSRQLSCWDFFGATFGIFSFAQVSLSPLSGLPLFLQLLDFPTELINRGTLILLFFSCSMSMYFLARNGPLKASRAASAIAGIFYSFGPYIDGEIWLGHWIAMFTYIAVPLVFLSIFKLFQSHKWQYWSIVLSLSSALFIFPRIRLLPYFFILCLAFVIYLTITHSRGLGNFMRGILFALPISFLSGSFYLLPTLSNLPAMFAPVANDYSTLTVNFPRTFNNPINLIGLVGYGVNPDLWGTLITSVFMSFFILGSMFIILYVVIIRRLAFDKFLLIVSSLFLLHMFMFIFVSGYRLWFVSLSGLFPSYFSALLFQKDLAYVSFPVSFCFALLFASVFDFFSSNKQRHYCTVGRYTLVVRHRTVYQFIVAAVVLVLSSQLIIPLENDPLRPISVPSYYQQTSKWVSQSNLDFKMADISSDPRGYSFYSWDSSMLPTTDIIRQIMPVPVVKEPISNDNSTSSIVLNEAYFASDPIEKQRALELLGIRYLINRTDILNSPDLNKFNSMSLNSSFKSGDIELLQLPSYAPLLYATTGYYLVLGCNNLFPTASSMPLLNFSQSAFIFVNETQLNEFNLTDFPRLIIATNSSEIERFQTLGLQNRQVVYFLNPDPFYGTIQLPENMSLYSFNSDGKTFLDSNSARDPRIGVFQNMSRTADFYKSDPNDILSTNYDAEYDCQINLNLSKRAGLHAVFLYPDKTVWNFTSLREAQGGIVLQLLGDGSSSEFRISLQCADPNNRYQWPLGSIRLDWVGWKTLVFPFSNFEKIGKPNFDSIINIALWLENNSINKTSLAIRGLAEYLGPTSILATLSTVNLDDFFSTQVMAINYSDLLKPKINIQLENSRPTLLIFNNEYDSGWVASSTSGQNFAHLVSNGYSNAFLISSLGSQNITIVYYSQFYYEIGIIMAVSTVCGAVFFLAFSCRRKLKIFIKQSFRVISINC
jgi:hypothetical protein